jgi:hypothetical protein
MYTTELELIEGFKIDFNKAQSDISDIEDATREVIGKWISDFPFLEEAIEEILIENTISYGFSLEEATEMAKEEISNAK